jgi:hypothetical protein
MKNGSGNQLTVSLLAATRSRSGFIFSFTFSLKAATEMPDEIGISVTIEKTMVSRCQ